MIRFDGPESLSRRRQPRRAGWGPASPRSRTGSTSLAGPPHRLMRDAGIGSLVGVSLVVAAMAGYQILGWLLAQLGDWWLPVGAVFGAVWGVRDRRRRDF